MREATIAGLKPCYLKLKSGRTYFWCACGLSKRQPLCDGSHKGTGFEPVPYKATRDDEEVLFCACKRTGDAPHCDGSHNNLPGAYEEDDPSSPENAAKPVRDFSDEARAVLDGGCYVFSPKRAELQSRGRLRYARVISPAQGAKHQSQFYAELTADGPVMSFGERHVILFIAAGEGEANISGRAFPITANMGVYIRPGEAFQLKAIEPLRAFISVCPGADEPEWPAEVGSAFDADHPIRRVAVDAAKRQEMADRYFQMLVDKSVGSTVATQFIGHIPKSKAAPHRHLYEEALIILSGAGMMWTETCKAPVSAGDVVFLPGKERHSLEATGPEGLDVVGVIYPGDNPSINY